MSHGYCEACSQTAEDVRRQNRQIYSKPKWRAFRAQFLQRFPFCGDRPGRPTGDSRCAARGLQTVGRVVDHVVRITGEQDPRFTADGACQTLCAHCHDVKSGRESHQLRTLTTINQGLASWG